MNAPRKLLRMPALRAKLGGVSNRTIERAMKSGNFPKPIKLTRQVLLWDEAVIDAWMERKSREAQTAPG
jgi:predicted DNA-binding transcriptional regulator AlpA